MDMDRHGMFESTFENANRRSCQIRELFQSVTRCHRYTLIIFSQPFRAQVLDVLSQAAVRGVLFFKLSELWSDQQFCPGEARLRLPATVAP